MSVIDKIKSLEVLDSRGNPTIYTEVSLKNGMIGTASVPSGASTGQYEACELRDQDPKRYLGKGVQTAINKIHSEIMPALAELDVCEQKKIDSTLCELDGTENKTNLGANAILSVSLACARAAAQVKQQHLYQYLATLFKQDKKSLPIPMMNVINGGAHADNALSIQEFMIVPHQFNSFAEVIQAGAEIFHTLKSELKHKGLNTNVGDEGGFAPNLQDNDACLDLLMESISKAGYEPGSQISLALDVAATEFYSEPHYQMNGKNYSAEELKEYYIELSKKYPIFSIEDPFGEDDWQGWQILTEAEGKNLQIVGDDLFVTNRKRLQQGIDDKAANAILIKLNQIGTLSETIDTIELANSVGFNSVISHRSGETEDPFIADLAVASGVGQIKTGSLSRTDRVAKYNRLLWIAAQESLALAQF